MSEILPPELTDRIIGFVGTLDKKTLCSCALVCRQWLPASRLALLYYVRVDSPRTYELLVSRVLHSDGARPYLADVRVLDIFHGWPQRNFPSP
ncbi:hypothetical protein OH76DRAFT_1305780, partial [Lentinus brumalis]